MLWFDTRYSRCELYESLLLLSLCFTINKQHHRDEQHHQQQQDDRVSVHTSNRSYLLCGLLQMLANKTSPSRPRVLVQTFARRAGLGSAAVLCYANSFVALARSLAFACSLRMARAQSNMSARTKTHSRCAHTHTAKVREEKRRAPHLYCVRSPATFYSHLYPSPYHFNYNNNSNNIIDIVDKLPIDYLINNYKLYCCQRHKTSRLSTKTTGH